MLVACLRVEKRNELRTFGTTTIELRNLENWLLENNCQIVAMESTGSFWKPIYNVLELFVIPAMVVNARHMKTVPGRKTDIKNESAGKRKSGKTTLIQCAKSAVKNKNTFFKAQYDKLVVRRGTKRATVAVAHTMLIAIYHMLRENTAFKDLDAEYYTKFNTDKKIKAYLKKLQELGCHPSTQAVS